MNQKYSTPDRDLFRLGLALGNSRKKRIHMKMLDQYIRNGVFPDDFIKPDPQIYNNEVKILSENGFNYSVVGSSEYPESFLKLPLPPLLLEFSGNPLLLNGPSVCIVGSRRASRRKMEFAKTLGSIMAQNGVTVVSGGAYGIDISAHRGAVSVNSHTAVFLGGGLLNLYPERHCDEFLNISKNGGLLISFLSALSTPRPWSFLQRNSVMAQISDATVICEAALKSGSLHTAGKAIESEKILCAVPHSPGCDLLIKKGAFYSDDPVEMATFLISKIINKNK
ncbi:MAG: DNA-processing protein DprA [Deltaproteobacteria bacterium]|nr:DNA-processing protein DprA [Deltaproteobacteria bacterium]